MSSPDAPAIQEATAPMRRAGRSGEFAERLRAVPTKPGVYRMRGPEDEVLYVGKASSLRSRLRSYFSSPSGMAPKIRTMVGKVADFDFIVTESDQEALILEYNLIKQHKPAYNARLKDDKSYPFIKIDMSEEFPLVYITRTVTRDGSRYFGPFASAYSVRRTLSLLKKLFPYRSCTKRITGEDPRACLDFYIHRCVAPCIGNVDKDQYQEVIDQVVLFLEGKADRVVKSIEARMVEAAEGLEFERAAVLRDQLRAVASVHEGQKVLHLTSENIDVIAAAAGRREAYVEIFFVRRGTLIGRDHFIMEGTQDDEPRLILTAFVKQFYGATPYVPPRILVQHPLEDAEALQECLAEKRQGPVRFHVPQRGEKRRLVEMVAENAAEGLVQLEVKTASDAANLDAAMTELEEALSLPKPPRRIECYDVSNIQGSNPVGSMVVFEDGKPKPSHYRRFKVESVKGVDDYSMMREVLTRRFKRLGRSREEGDSPAPQSDDTRSGSKGGWAIVPDLVLIDGGKGHLGAALQVFLELGIDFVPLASLAKENEELFVPHVREAIVLPRSSQGLFLAQRARDEAHRFAVTFHRQRRSKRTTRSALDSVPGIGPKRRRMLLRRFGSVGAIKEATLEDVAAVPGMTMRVAKKVKEQL